MTRNPRKMELSWGRVERLTAKLASKIKTSGFKPEYVIGIAIGGLVPLTLLTKELNTKDVATISARSYGKLKKGTLHVTALPDINLRGKKVLLVDEIADHGTTLRHISEMLHKRYKVAEVRTAVLIVKKHSTHRPDYVALQTDKWIIFPWEKLEWGIKSN